ncbi:MAG: MBL fold metallo-hydrolase [Verrucomicrobiota bacterium]
MSFLFESQLGVRVLASGSRGNVVCIQGGQATLLVDVGISGRRLSALFDELSYAIDSLEGVLLTHEHADHTKGLRAWPGCPEISVYGNSQTIDQIRESCRKIKNWEVFETGDSFSIGDFVIESFPVPHDAYDPVGFLIQYHGKSVAVLTDLGYVTETVVAKAKGADVIVLEANYDEQLLQSDSKRPWSVKQRIMARHGHLSNEQAAGLLLQISGSPLKHVFLGHMSKDCNKPEVAKEKIREALEGSSFDEVVIHSTFQNRPSDLAVV